MEPNYRGAVAAALADRRPLVTVTRTAAIATVTMNDPPTLNSLSASLCYQLRERLAELAADPDIQVVILTGADPAFSAGGDMELMRHAHRSLREGHEGAVGMWRWIRYQFGGVTRLLTQTDKVYIAAINGPAAGVGLAFAFACDILLASDRARLVTAFAKIGLLPEVGSSWLLTRRLGYHRAFELFLSGREIDGREAEAIGLVNKTVSHADLLPLAQEWADRVVRLPDSIVTMGKPLLRRAADATWEQAIAMEEYAEPICFTTAAHQTAIEAFVAASRRRAPA